MQGLVRVLKAVNASVSYLFLVFIKTKITSFVGSILLIGHILMGVVHCAPMCCNAIVTRRQITSFSFSLQKWTAPVAIIQSRLFILSTILDCLQETQVRDWDGLPHRWIERVEIGNPSLFFTLNEKEDWSTLTRNWQFSEGGEMEILINELISAIPRTKSGQRYDDQECSQWNVDYHPEWKCRSWQVVLSFGHLSNNLFNYTGQGPFIKFRIIRELIN